jgi:hypothetical protein
MSMIAELGVFPQLNPAGASCMQSVQVGQRGGEVGPSEEGVFVIIAEYVCCLAESDLALTRCVGQQLP